MKKFCAAALLASISAAIFAYSYNPPVGGETFRSSASPLQSVDGNSAVGGSLFMPTPLSFFSNPALNATERRVVIDIAYSALPRFKTPSSYSQSAAAGTSVPIPRGVISAGYSGVYSDVPAMPIGNLTEFYGAFSKEIVKNLSLGFGAHVGFGPHLWTLAANIGLLHRIDIPKISDFRWGVSLLNLGKPYKIAGWGVTGLGDCHWPGPLTVKAGVAATLLDVKNFKLAASIDLSTPTFLNFLADVGVGFVFADIVTLRTNFSFNARELKESRGKVGFSPSFAISAKFRIDTKFIEDAGKKTKNDWAQSEIVPTVASKIGPNDIVMLGAQTTIYLGLQNEAAPAFEIGD